MWDSIWGSFAYVKALLSKKYYQPSHIRLCIANHTAAPSVTDNIA